MATIPNDKNIYLLKKDLYTYGRVGEYSPRIKRVVRATKTGGKSRPSYVRVKGGVIPQGLRPEQRAAIGLIAALQAAEKVGEA